MTQVIRPAQPTDIPQLVPLLMLDAAERFQKDQILWKRATGAAEDVADALQFALTAEQQPFRQFWLVSEDDGRLTGVIHAMLLPVPPIYAGPKGDPGLILPDSFVAADAPDGTVDALLQAVEHALHEAGARLLLASFVTGDDWRRAFETHRYEPLTLYLSKAHLTADATQSTVRAAQNADIPGIVTQSAKHRAALFALDPFWEVHPEADTRFSAWMARSLTFSDRDMMVIGSGASVEGYVIAQPASRLHFPPAHSIAETGVIDDFFHGDLISDGDSEAGGKALLQAAEAAFAKRGIAAAFVVCPAKWDIKRNLLEGAGYETAMVWSIKR